MKISELIKILEARKKQFGNIYVVDDLGYITNDLIYNEDDNSLMIVTDTFRKVREMVKIEIRIQGAVRDNIVCKLVTEEQLSFLRTLEDDNWAFKGERPNLKITIIGN